MDAVWWLVIYIVCVVVVFLALLYLIINPKFGSSLTRTIIFMAGMSALCAATAIYVRKGYLQK